MAIEVVRDETDVDALAGASEDLATLSVDEVDGTAARLDLPVAAPAAEVGGDVSKVVAVAESEARLAELEAKLQRAEVHIAELRAQAHVEPPPAVGRKTLPIAAAHLVAKHGLDTMGQIHGGALDAALTGLSLEQRIAVKSQLLRAGLIG